ncbi:MAG: hypothetical protein IPM38_17600 [Ignavibacteria bacterium]|nr:hypothetical protein [Ignavibacteria bacterium]
MTLNVKKYFLSLTLFAFFLQLTSCCITKNDPPDLKQTAQEFPSTAGVNQSFTLRFTVQNFSSGECGADRSRNCVVELKMVDRATGHVQVNNFSDMNELDNNETQQFTFTVTIGTAGTYDLSFIIDPYNTSGDAVRDNNTYTSVVIIN